MSASIELPVEGYRPLRVRAILATAFLCLFFSAVLLAMVSAKMEIDLGATGLGRGASDGSAGREQRQSADVSRVRSHRSLCAGRHHLPILDSPHSNESGRFGSAGRVFARMGRRVVVCPDSLAVETLQGDAGHLGTKSPAGHEVPFDAGLVGAVARRQRLGLAVSPGRLQRRRAGYPRRTLCGWTPSASWGMALPF